MVQSDWYRRGTAKISMESLSADELNILRKGYEERLRAIMVELSRREPDRRQLEIIEQAIAGTLPDFIQNELLAQKLLDRMNIPVPATQVEDDA